MTKTAVYIRVSTTSQNEAGQRLELERWLKGHNITDAVFYVDKSTGNNLDREAFKGLQKDVFNGDVKTIVVYKLDRLSRSLSDGIATLTDWIEKGVRVVSITQQLDFAGPTGKLVASVLFAVAEMEQETRKERQAAGIEAAKERKVYKGRKEGTTKAKPKRATELRAKGMTYNEIANAMNVSQQTVRRYLGVVK